MMDESVFAVRPFGTDDYESFAAIQAAVRPDQPVSAETMRHEEEAFGPGLIHARYVVEERASGRAVAVAGVGQDPQVERGRLWVFALVRPDFRRRGIGARLFETLLASAREHRGVALRAFVREDELPGRAFLEKRGFVERRRTWSSLLDLAAFGEDRLSSLNRDWAGSGIELSTLAREGAHDPQAFDQIYRLDCETSVDVPRIDPFIPLTFATFQRLFIESPNTLPDAWFIAKDRGKFVAMSCAQRETAEPDTLEQAYTCTHREYRRRGLALALKLKVIEYGKRNHYRWIRTYNDSLNAPMWTLNERLGFRRTFVGIQTEKSLPREA